MTNVNQFKTVLFFVCIFIVMQSSACESRRQNKMTNVEEISFIGSEK